MRDAQHAHVGLLLRVFQRGRFVIRGDQYFHELAVEDHLRSRSVERLVEGDDAAESAGRVGGIGQFVGIAIAGTNGHAARVGMLDDDTGRRIELAHAFPCRIGIGQVVVAQFLALQLLEGGQRARHRMQVAVERATLVRVLAVAQVHHLHEGGIHLRRVLGTRRHGSVGGGDGRQVVADRRVVLGDAVERGYRESETGAGRQLAIVGVERGQQFGVLRRVGSHRHAGEVLGRRAQHRRTADVDVLHRIGQGAVGLGGDRFERIQVQHQQIDGADAVLGHHGVIQAGTAQQAAVHHRMQGLDPAIHHFREASDLGHVLHGQARIADRLGGTAGGQQLNAACSQRGGQFDQAGLVGNGKEGPADGQQISGHGDRAIGSGAGPIL
ncbi:hypothetical protein D3C72_937880 [compost metagenome]